MNSEKGNVILLTIIGVATLLVAVAGTTFSYFNATLNGVEPSTTIEVTSGTLKIDYADNSKINAGVVEPGATVATKTFYVDGIITGSSNLSYEAVLNIKNNTYPEGTLVYTITSKNDSKNGTNIASSNKEVVIPNGANKVVLGKGSFAGPVSTGARHTYTLTVKYIGTETLEQGNIEGTLALEQTTK